MPSNLNSQFATFIYSVLENLYLRVEMNFGFISTKNYFTSLTAVWRSSFEQFVNFWTSFVHESIFLSCLHERIRLGAACSEGLNLIRVMSSKLTSRMYWAKKNTSLLSNTGANLLYLSKNLQAEGDVILNSSTFKISFSFFILFKADATFLHFLY